MNTNLPRIFPLANPVLGGLARPTIISLREGFVSSTGLADASDSPADTHVQMTWSTPTQLELMYRGNQTVAFQAVKWANVNISVRERKSAASNTSQ